MPSYIIEKQSKKPKKTLKEMIEEHENHTIIKKTKRTKPKETEEPNKENQTIEATYRAMGKRSALKIAEHILKENTHEDNLINDIANVDYTKNHQGKTHLKKIEGFPVFVDDLYIYGYLGREDIAYTPKGKITNTEGVDGSARQVVDLLREAVRDTIAKNSNIPHINIMHTVEIGNQQNSSILKTIEEIEKTTPTRKRWEKRNNRQAVAVFVAKVDVSNIEMEELQKYTLELENFLNLYGYMVYCVDYTRDFSGTMDKEELTRYLREEENFKMEGESQDMDNENIILNNSSSVGRNVLTYTRKENNQNLRVKVYNKIVSNFEAGDVRQSFGGHLCDFVYSSNERLRRLFWHPDAKNRGISRLEVSLYGNQYKLNHNIGEFLISREFARLTKNEPLFYIQPAANQWQALAEKIGQCFALVDRPNNIIYIAWYGSSLTGRIAGVRIDYTKKKDKENIENLILWAMSDFAFKKVPIYRADILEYTTDSVRMSPLKAYTKPENTKTILTPCNRPGRFNKDALNIDIADYLPPTEFIKWEWRSRTLETSDDRKPTGEIIEMPELVKNRVVSLLSITEREKRNMEIEEARNKTEYIHKTEKILNEEKLNMKKETILYVNGKLKELEKIREKEEDAFYLVSGMLWNTKAQRIQDEDADKKYYILGWKPSKYSHMVLLLDTNTTDEKKYKVIFANKKIEKILKHFQNSFLMREERKNHPVYYFKPLNDELEGYFILEIQTRESFFINGEWVQYFPVYIDPIEEKLREELEKIREKEEETRKETQNFYLEETEPPQKAKYAQRCADIDEGEYRILSYSRSFFRGKEKTYLYLEKKDQPKNTFLVWGHWIEEEINKIEEKEDTYISGLIQPVFCRLGISKTTPNKKKARTCTISYNIYN